MGFIEEKGEEKLMRDERIKKIYEGKKGIKEIEIVMRKMKIKKGENIKGLMDEIKGDEDKEKD